jgi:hypothetical protein
MLGKRTTQLPLPVGERIEVRGLGASLLASHALTPLAFGESPSPRRGEGK